MFVLNTSLGSLQTLKKDKEWLNGLTDSEFFVSRSADLGEKIEDAVCPVLECPASRPVD
jgi:hypothetical protein